MASNAALIEGRAPVVDEYAALDAELARLRPVITRHEKLRELILGWYPNLPAEAGTTVDGSDATVVITPRDNERKVTSDGKIRLQKLWGPRTFADKCIVYLKNLPDPEDHEGLYTELNCTGPRHLKAFPRMTRSKLKAVPKRKTK